MAFTCGFFNSQNGDRKYNAEQMASIFDGLIKDGVYDTVGDIFAVTPGTGMQVRVGSGRAWFDHTWNNNDAQYPLAIAAADVSLPRYDAVVLETNHSDTVRTNRLRVLTGTPASNPAKPTMASSANVKQHPLAYIRVTAGATAITQSMIQVVVGTSECPFVTGIIETAQIDALFQQWNGEFDEWFDNLKAQLSDNVVANLQNQINQKVNKSDVATTADIEAGTSTTKWVSPKGLKDAGLDKNEVFQIGDIRSSVRTSLGDKYALANGSILTNRSSKYVTQNLADTSNGQTRFSYTRATGSASYTIWNGLGYIDFTSSANQYIVATILKDRFFYQSDTLLREQDALKYDYAHAVDDKVYIAKTGNSSWKIYIWDYKNTTGWTSANIAMPSDISTYNYYDYSYFAKYRGSIYCVVVRSTYEPSRMQIAIYKRITDTSWTLINSSPKYLSRGNRDYAFRCKLIATNNRLLLLLYSSNGSGSYFLQSIGILMADDALVSDPNNTPYFATAAATTSGLSRMPGESCSVAYNSNIGLFLVGQDYASQSSSDIYYIWYVAPSVINSVTVRQSVTLNKTNIYNLNPTIGTYYSGNYYIWTSNSDGDIYVGQYGPNSNVTSIYKVQAGPSLVENQIGLPSPARNPILTNGTDIMITGNPLICNAANLLPTVSIDGCYSYVKIK